MCSDDRPFVKRQRGLLRETAETYGFIGTINEGLSAGTISLVVYSFIFPLVSTSIFMLAALTVAKL